MNWRKELLWMEFLPSGGPEIVHQERYHNIIIRIRKHEKNNFEYILYVNLSPTKLKNKRSMWQYPTADEALMKAKNYIDEFGPSRLSEFYKEEE